MKRIGVMAFEDRARAEGGHAILLLGGVRRLPDPLRFELRLIDSPEGDEGSPDWLCGDHEPVAARLTREGLELTVGPEITEATEMLAGIAVEITVRDLGMKGEFLWPAIQLRARPKRRLVLTRPAAINARDGGGDELAEIGAHQAGADRFRGEPVVMARWPVAEIVPLQRRLAAMPEVPAPMPPPPEPDGEFAPATGADAGEEASDAAVPPGLRQPLPPPQMPREAAGPPRRSRFEAVDPEAYAWQQDPEWKASRSRFRFAGMVVLVTLGLQLLAYVMLGDRLSALAGWPGEAATEFGRRGVPVPQTGLELYELLVPETSEAGAGRAARADQGREALEMAARSLQGASGVRNTKEGAYWLRQYLAQRLRDPLILQSITQLGSVYAEPSAGRPDYVKAHRLWQISAAYGDPVAMCFLAALHANGLGVPADQVVARRWTSAAKAAGGCEAAPAKS